METTIITIIGIVIGFAQGIIIFILTAIKAEQESIWQRMNNHYHEIHCDNRECTALHTGNVIISGGSSK